MHHLSQYTHYDVLIKQPLLLYLVLHDSFYYIRILFGSFCYLFTLVLLTFLLMCRYARLLHFNHIFVLPACSNFLLFVFEVSRMILLNFEELTSLFDLILINYLKLLNFHELFKINFSFLFFINLFLINLSYN